jgi:hypothetical protein
VAALLALEHDEEGPLRGDVVEQRALADLGKGVARRAEPPEEETRSWA